MAIYFYFILNYILLLGLSLLRIPISIYIVMIMVSFSVVAFNYDPMLQQANSGNIDGLDLYRHFEALDWLRIGNVDNFHLEAPLSAWYFEGIVYFFDNNHFLPLFSVWIFYGISFIVFLKCFEYLNADINARKIALIFFVCMFDFFSTMNNIRFPIAIAMFWGIFYFDVVRLKKKAKYFYLIPLLFHPGVVMFLIVRILANFRLKWSFIFLLFVTLFVFLNLENIIQHIISIAYFWPDLQVLLLAISTKLFVYSTKTVYDAPLLYRIMRIYALFINFIIVLIAYNYRAELLKNIIFFRMELIIVVLIIIGAITNYMDGVFSGRMGVVLPFFSAIMVADLVGKIKSKSSKIKYLVLTNVLLLPITYLSVYLFKIYLVWIYLGL